MRKRLLGLVAAPLMLAQCDPGCGPVPPPPTTTTTTTLPPAALDTIVAVEVVGACADPVSLQVAFTNRSAGMNQMYVTLRGADGVAASPSQFVGQGETVVVPWPAVGGAPSPTSTWSVEVAATLFLSGTVSAGTITVAGGCQPDPDYEMRGAPGCTALRFENRSDRPLSVLTAVDGSRRSVVPAEGFVDAPWDSVIRDREGNPVAGAYAFLSATTVTDEADLVAGYTYERRHFCHP